MKDIAFNYMMLSRLQMDCKYYLGYGNRNIKHLWGDTVEEHIAYMKELYNGFSEDEKPEWITLDDIENYEQEMMKQD